MNSQKNSKDILDLLRAKYNQLREVAMEESNEEISPPITIAEWYILNCINEGITTAPEICAQLNISKQAAHKFIKGLEEKEFVETFIQKNKKTIQFTSKGEHVFKKTSSIKKSIDATIEQNIGTEEFQKLKELLEKEWL